jgi:hypothetical protein
LALGSCPSTLDPHVGPQRSEEISTNQNSNSLRNRKEPKQWHNKHRRNQCGTIKFVGVTVEKAQYLDLEKLAAAAMAVD